MKRVITYGTFDLLHYGHINLLRRAKALGDYLIVCLSTDEFNWNEKQKKCYFSYEQRKQLRTDAVSCFIIVEEPGKEPKLLLQKEFRYPIGGVMLGVTAGLMDKNDRDVIINSLHQIANIVTSKPLEDFDKLLKVWDDDKQPLELDF